MSKPMPPNNDHHSEESLQSEKKPGPLQVIASVLAAAFGVQSSKNRQRDFQHGSHKTYIITGIIFTILFIIAVATIVQIVLKKAG